MSFAQPVGRAWTGADPCRCHRCGALGDGHRCGSLRCSAAQAGPTQAGHRQAPGRSLLRAAPFGLAPQTQTSAAGSEGRPLPPTDSTPHRPLPRRGFGPVVRCGRVEFRDAGLATGAPQAAHRIADTTIADQRRHDPTPAPGPHGSSHAPAADAEQARARPRCRRTGRRGRRVDHHRTSTTPPHRRAAGTEWWTCPLGAADHRTGALAQRRPHSRRPVRGQHTTDTPQR
jgi:hypothetical protein